MMSPKKRVLILCTANSARSQMAEGLLRHNAGDAFDVFSAGTIKSYVRPTAIDVMREIGIDISSHWSKSLEEFAGQKFDYVITVCDSANESCPVFPGARRIHWGIEDPAAVKGRKEMELDAFRKARDELNSHLQEFAAAEK